MALLELVPQQWGRGRTLLETGGDPLGLRSPGGEVVRGESDVAAVQRAATDEVGMVAGDAQAESTRIVFQAQKLDLGLLADVPHLTWATLTPGFTGNIQELAKHPDLNFLAIGVDHQRQNLSVLQELPKLAHLNLYNLVSNQDLTVLTRLPKLRRLWLTGVPVTEELLAGLPALESLWLAPPAGWDPRYLSPLTSLRTLSLFWPGEPPGGISQLTDQLHQLSNLENLYLSGCAWLRDLVTLTSLDTLTDLAIDDASASDLSPLAGLTRLQWLSIGNEEHQFDLTPLAGLTQLKVLWITASAPGLDLAPLHGKRMTVHVPRRVKLADAVVPTGVRIRHF